MHPESDGYFIAATRTAMMVQKAVERVSYNRNRSFFSFAKFEDQGFQAIGHCSTKIRLSRAANQHYFNCDEEPDDKYVEGSAFRADGRTYVQGSSGQSSYYREEEEVLKNEADKEPLTRNEVLVERLALLAAQMPVHASGMLDTPFTLAVSRPGCALRGAVQPTSDYCAPQSAEAQQLARLFANAAVAGYGDMRTHETKVDCTVRQAREIGASEFTVEPALLERVCVLWAGHLGPHNVRAEPYKIHLYAEGGHFDTHLDTPERGLVGTFLLGAGDSTGEENLELSVQREYSPHTPLWDSDEENEVMEQGAESQEVMEDTQSQGGGDTGTMQKAARSSRGEDNARHTFSAKPGHWVAFYPDVPHRVTAVKSGFRAVVAFKIFQDDGPDQAETEAETATIAGIRYITDALEAPVGLILRRKYCLETHRLSGFDALLYTALMRRADVDVHLLPIVISFSASVGLNEECAPVSRSFGALVYPFTAEHIDYLGGTRMTDPAKSTMPWLTGVKKTVQFLAMDFHGSTVEWSHKTGDDTDYRGNEARAYSEDSVYLSYALVVIPKTAKKEMKEMKAKNASRGGRK
ncbi:hypothetical protein FA95DRAFT_72795 [Auriscalpium vulgare]|uniref:Uncharacterized protein n=1 Tax=Auriscalpium vulgare TaxID=40419 RepID=A0ACB8RQ38_9AGAM|nr:hypothetical protein FA95DRAFT_72795 [Auriscalpium vulgare]